MNDNQNSERIIQVLETIKNNQDLQLERQTEALKIQAEQFELVRSQYDRAQAIQDRAEAIQEKSAWLMEKKPQGICHSGADSGCSTDFAGFGKGICRIIFFQNQGRYQVMDPVSSCRCNSGGAGNSGTRRSGSRTQCFIS